MGAERDQEGEGERRRRREREGPGCSAAIGEGEVILRPRSRMLWHTEHSRLQMGEWMRGEEEREIRWSGEAEQGTSRDGDLQMGKQVADQVETNHLDLFRPSIFEVTNVLLLPVYCVNSL